MSAAPLWVMGGGVPQPWAHGHISSSVRMFPAPLPIASHSQRKICEVFRKKRQHAHFLTLPFYNQDKTQAKLLFAQPSVGG